MKRWLLAAAAVGLVAVSGCSISTDDGPRDIDAADRVELRVPAEQSGAAATGTARIYLLSPETAGQAQTLQAAARDVSETAPNVLNALFAGPNSDEVGLQLRSALPAGTRLLGATLQGGVLLVNVTNELQQLSGEELIDATAQIVLTASEVDGVRGVRIAIEGDVQQWPAGNGELRRDPLTRFDYPGLVLSSQPDFPAIPSAAPATAP